MNVWECNNRSYIEIIIWNIRFTRDGKLINIEALLQYLLRPPSLIYYAKHSILIQGIIISMYNLYILNKKVVSYNKTYILLYILTLNQVASYRYYLVKKLY